MKHAYLIIAHGQWSQLENLVSLLDYENNDIYIHIDKKAKDVPLQKLKEAAKISKIKTYQKYKVYWGSFELVQVELMLYREAYKVGYDYYHLLSGSDLPIKSIDYINSFFIKNNGKEFVHFDTDKRLEEDHEIDRRTRLYHFLQNYRRRYKQKIFNDFFTFLERCSLGIQLILRVDRRKKYTGLIIKYGSQWSSITHELVGYILEKEELIYDVFKHTNCADELFIQTLVFNSKHKEHLYDKNYDDSPLSNMRLIDMKKRGKNGNPYTWLSKDIDEIRESQCLFARKFNVDVDGEIFEKIKELY